MLSRLVVLVAAISAGAIGIVRGTWAVGGSDSSCYALMADAFARGALQPSTPLATAAPWPDAPRTFAPGGFIPSPRRVDAASPICSPGFALLIAPLRAIGPDAIFFFTPVAGALVVWWTFVLGRQIAGDLVGAAAAVTIATTPVFLFQLVQPMNDVTVAAIWTAIVVIAARLPDRPGVLGGLCGLAILVRPNLAPSVLPVAIWAIAMAQRRWYVAGSFLIALSPGVIFTLALNHALYGHALSTGYGAGGDLFSTAYALANVRNYGSALFATTLGFPLLGLAAVKVLRSSRRAVAGLVVAIATMLAITYLLYSPFAEWWYLRFFLPVLPMLTVLAFAVLELVSRRSSVVVGAAAGLVLFMVTSEATAQAMDLSRLEARFRLAGEVMHRRLPDNAVFITVWESGSARYHAQRDAVLWDSLDPQWLDRAVAWLKARGLHPFIAVEEWEEEAFRNRFAAHAAIGSLDWPPRFDVARRVRIFDPDDRARYLAGEPSHTENVWPDRR